MIVIRLEEIFEQDIGQSSVGRSYRNDLCQHGQKSGRTQAHFSLQRFLMWYSHGSVIKASVNAGIEIHN